MDDPAAPRAELEAALAFLRRFNRRLGGVRPALRRLERAASELPADRPIRVIDIGTGSADIPLAMARWAERRGRAIEIDAIDMHPATVAAARAHVKGCAAIEVIQADATQLMDRYEPGAFDIAHAALFLHHLSDVQVLTVLRVMDRLAAHGVIWTDIVRGPVARLGVRLLTIGAGSMAKHDGRVSVEAGFTRAEALDLARRAGIEHPRCATRPGLFTIWSA